MNYSTHPTTGHKIYDKGVYKTFYSKRGHWVAVNLKANFGVHFRKIEATGDTEKQAVENLIVLMKDRVEIVKRQYEKLLCESEQLLKSLEQFE